MLCKLGMKHMKEGHPPRVCNFNTSIHNTVLKMAPTQMTSSSLNNDNQLEIFKASMSIKQQSFIVFQRYYCPYTNNMLKQKEVTAMPVVMYFLAWLK